MRIIELDKLRFVAFSMAAVGFLTLLPSARDTIAAPPSPPSYSGNRPQSIKDGVQIQTVYREDLVAMEDAIPTKALVKPKQPRKVLVLCKAAGFVHSSIPLAAATVKAMGEKTGAYTATITYDSADITAANLAQYDAIFLDSTTLAFLDDPNDAAAPKLAKGIDGICARGKGPDRDPCCGGFIPHYRSHNRRATHRNLAGVQQMIGGYFKFHWVYPQVLTVKIDDPGKKSVDIDVRGEEFQIHDETYTNGAGLVLKEERACSNQR